MPEPSLETWQRKELKKGSSGLRNPVGLTDSVVGEGRGEKEADQDFWGEVVFFRGEVVLSRGEPSEALVT